MAVTIGANEELTSSSSPSTTAAIPPAYLVHLPVFDGPLDLLLYLIERNQLEISTVSLVSVTDQFIQYLRNWEQPPLPRLAEFVAMAARLLLIKSRSLLPRQGRGSDSSEDSDPLADAEQLRRHLLEYKMTREIAEALRARETAGLQSFARPQLLATAGETIPRIPPQIVGVSAEALAVVFRRVLAEKRLTQPEELALPLVTIAEKIAEVEAVLRAEGHAILEALLQRASSRFEVVVMFLAVLELWHQARLKVIQSDLFGSIEIRPGRNFTKSTTGPTS
jgi:segregation and condensation protein A